MNCCRNCRHWYQTAADKAMANMNGQCRAVPPTTSYNWPRSRSDDFCSAHSAHGETNFAQAPASQQSQPAAGCDAEHRAAPTPEAPATRRTRRPRPGQTTLENLKP